VTAKLADTIGTGRADKTTPSSKALLEALNRFGRTVGKHVLVLAASVDEDDDASVERYLSAIQPIEAHRASMVRGGGGGEEEEEDDAVRPVLGADGKPISPAVVVAAPTPTTTSPPTNGSPTGNSVTPPPVAPTDVAS
jgi:hypothetical protein